MASLAVGVLSSEAAFCLAGSRAVRDYAKRLMLLYLTKGLSN